MLRNFRNTYKRGLGLYHHMDRTKEILIDLGFEDREIKVYLALLRDNTRPAFQISKETRIDRTTTTRTETKQATERNTTQHRDNNRGTFQDTIL